jgi:hypothetical protein
MEQYSKNKYTCDISMNEIRMGKKPLLELENNGSIQIKGSRNP